MKAIATKTWEQILKPLLRRPPLRQVAALCWRDGSSGREVLMITSRDTGRWILPKGWPIRGMDSPAAALREAYEEAGVASVDDQAPHVGRYAAQKRRGSGLVEPCDVDVYASQVKRLLDEYPEAGHRRRRWMKPTEAAGLVVEPGLARILETFADAGAPGR